MPIPEGMNSAPPPQEEGFTKPQEDGTIDPSEREEVVLVPLYGLVHDSPIITAVQKATRRGRKGRAADYVEKTQWLDAAVVPYLEKIYNKIHGIEEKKEEQN
jgi:hypothetical protein